MWHITMRVVLALTCLLNSFLSKSVTKSVSPPVFFLQDLNDGKCISGGTFVRCTVDTLWTVVGKPGSYQLHKKAIEESVVDEELCLDRQICHEDESDVRTFSCSHCGAKSWNILGDSQTGTA
jgi:hypothetical protein